MLPNKNFTRYNQPSMNFKQMPLDQRRKFLMGDLWYKACKSGLVASKEVMRKRLEELHTKFQIKLELEDFVRWCDLLNTEKQ